MTPLVSIIIPVFNVENYIIQCLTSVIHQTYNHLEIIIIDDCGIDNSMSLIYSFISQYKGPFTFKIIKHKYNKGLSAARNTGTSEAKGEYIFYIDSDDMITPDCITLLVNKAITTNAEMVTADYKMIGGEDFFKGHLKKESDDIFTGSYNILEAYCIGLYNITAWNKLIRLDFLKSNNIKFIENILHEDNPWNMEIAYKLSKVALVKKVTYLYVFRKESISNNKIKLQKKIESMRFLVEYNFVLAKRHPEYMNSKALFEFNINKLLIYLQCVNDNLGINGLKSHLTNIENFKYNSKFFSIFAKGLHGSHRMWMIMYYIPRSLRPIYFKIIMAVKNKSYKNGNKSINNNSGL